MQSRRHQFNSWVRKIWGRRDRLPTPVFLGFPCSSVGKESAYNAGHLGWEDPLENGKATHSSILAWIIPWTITSMGSQRAGHNGVTFHSFNTPLCYTPPRILYPFICQQTFRLLPCLGYCKQCCCEHLGTYISSN